jgi:hypothetical protein
MVLVETQPEFVDCAVDLVGRESVPLLELVTLVIDREDDASSMLQEPLDVHAARQQVRQWFGCTTSGHYHGRTGAEATTHSAGQQERKH